MNDITSEEVHAAAMAAMHLVTQGDGHVRWPGPNTLLREIERQRRERLSERSSGKYVRVHFDSRGGRMYLYKLAAGVAKIGDLVTVPGNVVSQHPQVLRVAAIGDGGDNRLDSDLATAVLIDRRDQKKLERHISIP